MFMLGFPLLLVPFAIYNIIAFLRDLDRCGFHGSYGIGRRLDYVDRRHTHRIGDSPVVW
jgi:hypothetical protein